LNQKPSVPRHIYFFCCEWDLARDSLDAQSDACLECLARFLSRREDGSALALALADGGEGRTNKKRAEAHLSIVCDGCASIKSNETLAVAFVWKSKH
jgi:hypothetical protein